MAFAAACAQRDILSDKRNALIILEGKINKAKEELRKLKRSYDTAVDDIQRHYMNASASLTSIKEAAEKAVDAYMHEYQRRLREELEKMEDLKHKLSPDINNKVNKMNKESHSEDNSKSNMSSEGHILPGILEMHVETVPNIRFLGNEAFLFRVVNGNHLPYFGCITLDNKILASDLNLHCDKDPETQGYTFHIDVPRGASECEDLKSRIKCEVFQKDTGTSITLTPVWVTDHFEVKFGFIRKTPFSVGVYLLDQHITGSPANINPENDLLDKDCDDRDMEIVKTPAKRRIGTPDPVIEAALREINSSSDHNNNSRDANNNDDLNKNIMETSKAHLSIADGVFKISKKTKIPCTSSSNSSMKRHRQVYQSSLKEGTTSVEESDVCSQHAEDLPESASSGFPKILARLTKDHPKKLSDCVNDNTVSMRDLTVTNTKHKTFIKDELNQQNGYSPSSFMVKTMSFNTVDAHLVYTTTIESPYSLDRPVGVLEHSSGVILVSDTFNNRVLRLDGKGGPISIAGPSMAFRRPSALVELSNGSVAVICINFIAMFDADGNYLRSLGVQLLQKPYGLCLSDEGKLMTIETAYPGTLVIVTICPELELELSRVRVPLELPAQRVDHSKPRFIASYKDKLYVGDLGLNCVYEVNYTTGCLLNIFGSTGTAPGCMVDPSGIGCDRSGNIYVADSRNHRIQVFDSSRRIICIIGVDYPLNRPSGICLTENDDLFVLNYWDNSLAKYHLEYTYI